MNVFEKLIQNKAEIWAVATNQDLRKKNYVSDELHDIAVNEEFWTKLSKLTELLRPLCSALNNLQGDNSISNVQDQVSKERKKESKKKERKNERTKNEHYLDSN